MKPFLNRLFSRMVLVCLALILQIAIIAGMFTFLAETTPWVQLFFNVLALVLVLVIINRNGNPAYKIAWLVPILILPLFGTLLFCMFGRNKLSRRQIRRMKNVETEYIRAMDALPSARLELLAESPDAALQSGYLEKVAAAPVYRRTQSEFLKIGEDLYARMLQELKRAEKFIFLEYFIIEAGTMWDSILEILEEKARAGLDVRVIYDDFGCILKVPSDFNVQLEKKGIRCCAFHRFVPVLSASFNNRDHRKICVIDGNVGFTGGINLADEYINARQRFGHWLDCGVMLRGEAVWSFTAMFLSMWNCQYGTVEDFEKFLPDPGYLSGIQDDGYVQPFTDTPLDDEAVGETVYLNLISRARRYVYICTPYLIIDNEMLTALSTAAKCGIDVRIVTPHIPDKKMVHALTRSYYSALVHAGVRVYEYTPGFIHSKTFVCDGVYGVCGSINLDFRSLYLHYECAAWMYGASAVRDMERDFLNTLKRCEEITPDWCRRIPLPKRILQSILRAFAPLI